ncbi:hypothetical protein FB451DRAFT_1558567 [Mycena latifolia]|nr:hypothetical protein FB451DRAFT_1534140 [Mycena latifolia]KAJ7450530.1 hypothetical protein FB451DRAFT_1285440 [Mycena latifolia]KAJ7473310.1 hypothetical protein FB451DRAFT_1558567 [Mycena latifolia]
MPYERDYLLPLFSAPRPAPLPSPRSSRSSPPPQGFVVPPIPPRDCPLSIIIDEAGHRRLPLVSGNPLPVDHERVRKLVRHRLDITAKCANCAEMAIDCEFFEAGVPCPPCVVLGIPDCQFADPHDFMLNLRHRRDAHFLHEREVLCAAVRDNQLAPSLFEREYEHACSWFYSAAQGAISRFLINCHSTGQLAFRGYQALAASSTDASMLSRFLSFGHDARIHPSVLRAVVDRLQVLFLPHLEE